MVSALCAWVKTGPLPPPRLTRRQMRFSHIRIDLNTVSGLILNLEITGLDDRHLVDHQVMPPIDVLCQLENPERPLMDAIS